jgi:hypothetical protein
MPPSAPQTSSIDRSHHDPVYDVFWIQSKTNNQFASVSTDGQMMWWDTRKLTEPTEVLQLNDGASELRSVGALPCCGGCAVGAVCVCRPITARSFWTRRIQQRTVAGRHLLPRPAVPDPRVFTACPYRLSSSVLCPPLHRIRCRHRARARRLLPRVQHRGGASQVPRWHGAGRGATAKHAQARRQGAWPAGAAGVPEWRCWRAAWL